MSEPEYEVSCENCVAACCRAPVNMIMTADEHKRHGKTMDLQIVAKPSRYPQRVPIEKADDSQEQRYLEVPGGFGLFELVSGCANLTETHRCSIYTSRPNCCRDFEMGSSACLKARREAGLDADQPPLEEEAPARVLTITEQLATEFFPTSGATTGSDTDRGETPIVAPSLGLAQVRMLVARENTAILQRLRGCDAGVWSRRTRCAAWDVGALAAHLVSVEQFAAAVLSAALECRVAKPPRDFSGTRAATAEEFGRAAESVQRLLGEMPVGRVQGDVRINDDEVTVDHLLQVLAMELAVHGCDLAAALGEEHHLDADGATAVARALPDLLDQGSAPGKPTSYVLRSATFEMPFTWRNNTWQHFAGPDACVIEGEPEAVLLFALGREPFSESRLRTNRPQSARLFKRHLTGP